MTQTILFLTPNLEPCSATTQLVLLASGLPADRFDRIVCVLEQPGAVGDDLRAAGVRVHALGWQRVIDLAALARLRTLVAEHRPDVLHAWRLPGFRIGWLLRRWKGGRLIVSSSLHPRDGGGRIGLAGRWLLRRADCVVAAGPAEAQRLRQISVRDDRLTVIPPGVTVPELPPVDESETRRRFGLPDGARMILVVGPLERYKGGYEAIWAFDMVGQIVPNLHLVLAGAGRELPRLRHFAAELRGSRRVHFVGLRHDLPALFSAADLVWAPVRADSGTGTVLEAMAAGVPVIASRVPALAEIVAEGETGVLVWPGDKAALSRQTRLLLDDDARRRQMGAAARQRVTRYFSAAAMCGAFARLYGTEL